MIDSESDAHLRLIEFFNASLSTRIQKTKAAPGAHRQAMTRNSDSGAYKFDKAKLLVVLQVDCPNNRRRPRQRDSADVTPAAGAAGGPTV